MTIIAVRDGVMAADSLINDRGRLACGMMRKVIRAADGTVAGASGGMGDMARFLAWVDGFMAGPFEANSDAFEGLILRPDGTVSVIDHYGAAAEIAAPFYATGSGADVALGAMGAGASAEEAVRVAIRLNLFCGGDVIVERLR